MFKLYGTPRILVLGYGDPDFLDDGLGPALAEMIDGLALPGVKTASCDDLNLDTAASVAGHDLVIFAGVAIRGAAPFAFRPLRAIPTRPVGRVSGLEPGALLYLVQRLYGRTPEGYGLAIRGYEFGSGPGLSVYAQEHLVKAVAFVEAAIRLKLAA